MRGRSIIKKRFLSGLFLPRIIALFGLLLVPAVSLADDTIAEMVEIEGESEITYKETGKKVPVKEGMRVGPGDGILTRPKSSVTLFFDDGNFAKLEGDTSAAIGDPSSAKGVAMRLDYGSMEASLIMPEESETEFEIVTKKAVVSATGTITYTVRYFQSASELSSEIAETQRMKDELKIEILTLEDEELSLAENDTDVNRRISENRTLQDITAKRLHAIEADQKALGKTVASIHRSSGKNPGSKELSDSEIKSMADKIDSNLIQIEEISSESVALKKKKKSYKQEKTKLAKKLSRSFMGRDAKMALVTRLESLDKKLLSMEEKRSRLEDFKISLNRENRLLTPLIELWEEKKRLASKLKFLVGEEQFFKNKLEGIYRNVAENRKEQSKTKKRMGSIKNHLTSMKNRKTIFKISFTEVSLKSNGGNSGNVIVNGSGPKAVPLALAPGETITIPKGIKPKKVSSPGSTIRLENGSTEQTLFGKGLNLNTKQVMDHVTRKVSVGDIIAPSKSHAGEEVESQINIGRDALTSTSGTYLPPATQIEVIVNSRGR